MSGLPPVMRRPIWIPMVIVGTLLAPLFLGLEQVGADADYMYRPIKEVLAEGLREGRIPFWSDRFGVGVPLVAESHMAAFYPPNWVLYRIFSVSTAFRLSMWFHYVAIAALTYLYGRRTGLTPHGSIAASLVLTLGGFLAVHAIHEPLYCLMPYLPLCLILADGYVATGGLPWLAGLALAWGVQVMVGHFQLQMWTAGLVLVTGFWRIATQRLSPWRCAGLCIALAWGAAIAWVQLRLTWELTRVAGFDRGAKFLSNYLFPLSHWSQWAFPAVFFGGQGGFPDLHWSAQTTTSEEGNAYVGVTALILAFAGLLAPRRDGRITPLIWLIPVGFLLATLPQWWPQGFAVLVMLPGLGWFRAPGRYTLLCNLGLAMLAGRGLDPTIPPRAYRVGVLLALCTGILAFAWTYRLIHYPDIPLGTESATLAWRLAGSALVWPLALGVIVAWRRGWMGIWGPLGMMTLELGILFYLGSPHWGWAVRLPEESAVMMRLRSEPHTGLIAGKIQSLPVRAGLTPAYPSMGITAPPPNYLLEASRTPPGKLKPGELRWLRRLGVSHGVWNVQEDVRGTKTVEELSDLALDRLEEGQPGAIPHVQWKVVRYPRPFPDAWVALAAKEFPGWGPLYETLSQGDFQDQAFFVYGEGPVESSAAGTRPLTEFLDARGNITHARVDNGIPAQSARLLEWNGVSGTVEHDGTCYLIVRRAAYPGWSYRIDGGRWKPVLKASGSLQCVPLPVLKESEAGSLRKSHVELSYEPTGWTRAALLSAATAVLALGCVAVGTWQTRLALRRAPA